MLTVQKCLDGIPTPPIFVLLFLKQRLKILKANKMNLNSTLPTLELMSCLFHGDTINGINYLVGFKSNPPIAPVLQTNHGVQHVLEYARKLEKHLHTDLPAYYQARMEAEANNMKLDALIKEFIALECGLAKFEPHIQYSIVADAAASERLGGYMGFYYSMKEGCRLYSPNHGIAI